MFFRTTSISNIKPLAIGLSLLFLFGTKLHAVQPETQQVEQALDSTLIQQIEDNLDEFGHEVDLITEQALREMIQHAPVASQEAVNAARSVCYSALTGNNNHSIILVPLPDKLADLDAVCHIAINTIWHAGGIAKGAYFHQDCIISLENRSYGGGYTSYVTEDFFESNRRNYPNCGPANAFICCSPQFPN